jgi:hypothetical protein
MGQDLMKKHLQYPSWNIILILILTSCLLISNKQEIAAKNSRTIEWTNPTIIAEVQGVALQTMYPVIAADDFGTVHVFWTTGYTIFYISKDSTSWSNPIDVVWSNSANVRFPSVAIDKRGYLHLVWVDNGDIFHKSVHVRDAREVRKWSNQTKIADIGMAWKNIEIAVDHLDHLNVVFVEFYDQPGKTKGGNVYHIYSEDNGLTWSPFLQVSTIQDNELAWDPRMAFDSQNRVHIVWGVMAPLLFGQHQGVHYARLSPDKKTTEIEVEIDHRRPETKWMMSINIAILPNDEVHLVWTCTIEKSWRCHTWSIDGGDNWQKNQTYFDNLVGHSGWDAIQIDGAGNLYWITVLRYPQAMYYSTWINGSWIDPPIPATTEEGMNMGEDVRAAVNLGNKIYLVAQISRFIYYMEGETNAPKVEPFIVSTKEPEAKTSNTDTNLSNQVVETAISKVTENTGPIIGDELNIIKTNEQVRLIGIIPVILIFFLVGAFRFKKKYFS